MGAATHYRAYNPCSEKELRKKFADQVAQLRYEKGADSYGGDWHLNDGLQILSQTFKTVREAEDYLDPRLDKRGYVLAVPVGDFEKASFPRLSTDKSLVEHFEPEREQLHLYECNILERARHQKSTMKTCEHCQTR